VQLWSENYDRNLTDIFAIQEEIAQAIAASLRVPLGLQHGESLVHSRTKSDANYEDYLRAKALFRARGYNRLVEASKLLEQVVAREPDYAPAWALLGLDDFFIPVFHPAYLSGAFEQARPVIDTYLPKAEAAATRAIQIDPKSPEGYSALGLVQFARGNALQSADFESRALALDPDNPDSLHIYSDLLANLGYLKQALPMRRRLQVLEPFVPIFAEISAEIMHSNGQVDEALTLLKAFPQERVSLYLASILSSQGRYHEVADALSATPRDVYFPGTVDKAVDLLRAAPTPAPPATLGSLGALGLPVYPAVGASERILDIYEGAHKSGIEFPIIFFAWSKQFETARKTDRFKSIVRNAGYVDYWKARGWPDLCHPVGADDFACD
jgi:tetratricopeptide (TPR) repeat protein